MGSGHTALYSRQGSVNIPPAGVQYAMAWKCGKRECPGAWPFVGRGPRQAPRTWIVWRRNLMLMAAATVARRGPPPIGSTFVHQASPRVVSYLRLVAARSSLPRLLGRRFNSRRFPLPKHCDHPIEYSSEPSAPSPQCQDTVSNGVTNGMQGVPY